MGICGYLWVFEYNISHSASIHVGSTSSLYYLWAHAHAHAHTNQRWLLKHTLAPALTHVWDSERIIPIPPSLAYKDKSNSRPVACAKEQLILHAKAPTCRLCARTCLQYPDHPLSVPLPQRSRSRPPICPSTRTLHPARLLGVQGAVCGRDGAAGVGGPGSGGIGPSDIPPFSLFQHSGARARVGGGEGGSPEWGDMD